MPLPVRFGDGYETTARVVSFDGLVDGREHLALGLGDRATAADLAAVVAGGERSVPLVRPHSECLTGDVFGSRRCDCGPQLHAALRRVADAEHAALAPLLDRVGVDTVVQVPLLPTDVHDATALDHLATHLFPAT